MMKNYVDFSTPFEHHVYFNQLMSRNINVYDNGQVNYKGLFFKIKICIFEKENLICVSNRVLPFLLPLLIINRNSIIVHNNLDLVFRNKFKKKLVFSLFRLFPSIVMNPLGYRYLRLYGYSVEYFEHPRSDSHFKRTSPSNIVLYVGRNVSLERLKYLTNNCDSSVTYISNYSRYYHKNHLGIDLRVDDVFDYLLSCSKSIYIDSVGSYIFRASGLVNKGMEHKLEIYTNINYFKYL